MRIQGWPTLLNKYFLEVQERYKLMGLEYGKLDCCIYVADWILACTGVDHMESYRGTYSTKEEAFKLLEDQGDSLLSIVEATLGPPIHPSQAQRGDIAYHEKIRGLGIFFTSGAKKQALFLGDRGFAIHTPKECTHAFRVE